MTPSERQKKYRRRCRNGVVVLRAPVQFYDLVSALIATKRISEQAALDRAEVDRAVSVLLLDFVKRWPAR
jgi:hypothetical protein